LEETLRRDGIVRDPIIVDIKSCVVLDGMHRLAALRELRCHCVPVCAVDYLNPSVTVGLWYRTLSGPPSCDEFAKALSSSDLELERRRLDTAGINVSPQLAMLFASDESLTLRTRGFQVYPALRSIEQCARAYGAVIGYESEHDALEKLATQKVDAVITLPWIDKP